MIRRDHHLLMACRMIRYGFTAIEAAETLDPGLTPYVQAAVGRAFHQAGMQGYGGAGGVLVADVQFMRAAAR